MKAKQKRSAALLGDCISERSGDPIHANFWIKVGLPRIYLTKLKALGYKSGFQKTPTAAAVRLIVLVGLLHPEEIESWIAEVEAKHHNVMPLCTEYKGCDPVQN